MRIDEIAQGNCIEEKENGGAQGRVITIAIFKRQVEEEGI